MAADSLVPAEPEDDLIAIPEGFTREEYLELERIFIRSNVATAFWSDNEISELDDMSEDDLTPESKLRFKRDCRAFLQKAWPLLQSVDPDLIPQHDSIHRGFKRVLDYAGHDFWLTRNRHGAGFWDGLWPEAVADKLVELSHAAKEVNLLTEGGKVYLE